MSSCPLNTWTIKIQIIFILKKKWENYWYFCWFVYLLTKPSQDPWNIDPEDTIKMKVISHLILLEMEIKDKEVKEKENHLTNVQNISVERIFKNALEIMIVSMILRTVLNHKRRTQRILKHLKIVLMSIQLLKNYSFALLMTA